MSGDPDGRFVAGIVAAPLRSSTHSAQGHIGRGLKRAEASAIVGRMKTTIDIPPGELRAVVKNTGAKRRAEAVLMAVKEFNRRRKLAALAEQLKGSLPNLMTLEDLKAMRENGRWEAAK